MSFHRIWLKGKYNSRPLQLSLVHFNASNPAVCMWGQYFFLYVGPILGGEPWSLSRVSNKNKEIWRVWKLFCSQTHKRFVDSPNFAGLVLKSVFVWLANCICTNSFMYLSKSQQRWSGSIVWEAAKLVLSRYCKETIHMCRQTWNYSSYKNMQKQKWIISVVENMIISW